MTNTLREALQAVHDDLLMRAERDKHLEDGEIVVAVGAGVWNKVCEALSTPRGDEGEAVAETPEVAADNAATFCIEHLAKMLGDPDYVASDGSEEWEGDVAGTINNVLEAARVLDPWDWAVARHETFHEERARAPTSPSGEDSRDLLSVDAMSENTKAMLRAGYMAKLQELGQEFDAADKSGEALREAKCKWCNDTGWAIGNGKARDACLQCDAHLTAALSQPSTPPTPTDAPGDGS